MAKALVWEGGKPVLKEPTLTPKQFVWMLASTGLDDVWAALEGHLKETDRAAYALIRSQRESGVFILSDTLAMVAQFRDAAELVAPEADLSDEAITAAWTRALNS